MATWEYDVVRGNNRSHLADQLKDGAEEGWEPILYQLATALRSSSQGVDELHYVIVRRSPGAQ